MPGSPFRRIVGRVAVAALAVVAPVALSPTPASAAAGDLFISEYIEGSSFNKAIEIYNGTGAGVDLDAGGYQLELYSNGSATVSQSVALTGTVAAGDVYVVVNEAANGEILAQSDLTSNAVINFNGDDAVVLRKGTTVLDVFGQIGFDPGSAWGSGDTSTLNHTLRRMANVCAGDPNGADAFTPSTQWDGFAQDTFDGLGAHTATCGPVVDAAPTVTNITPADGSDASTSVAPTVTFSEDVTLAAGALTLECTSGVVAAVVSGGGKDYRLTPSVPLAAGEDCTFTVIAANVSDVDDNDPPDNLAADVATSFGVVDTCEADITPTYDIQGSGADAAITGPVVTRGVVVADYEGSSPKLRGFYLQDATGDGDPSTSDAIFVFNGSNDSVSLGDVVTVAGTASDFQDQTQVSSVTAIDTCGTATVAPTEVRLPMASAGDYEKYEGMLVTMPQTLSVTEHFQLGRFGQVTVSSGGRLQQPTNVVDPGAEAIALQAQNDLNRVIIDDTLQSQNPDPIIWGRGGDPLTAQNTLRGGDTVTGATGIMTYGWAGNGASPSNWRLRPLTQSGDGITFVAANPRPEGPEEVGGDVRVVGMNLLNYFNTLDTSANNCTGGVTGPPMDCRGANTALELERQTAKTVAAIVKLDADVIGVNEVENDGYGPDSALQELVDAVNADGGAGTYAVLDVDDRTGEVDALGSDAIKVGLIYRPDAVTPVGDTAALNTVEFVNGGDASPKNRPSLAQAWKVNETDGVFITDVNHLKSKGSACETPDLGDGQANCAIVRTNAVRALLDWLGDDPTGTGDQDILLVGDYNSYAMETPIKTLEEGGFVNLVREFIGEDAYSYVFDGQWGYLDQALGSEAIVDQVTGVSDYHINADEPSVLDYNTDFQSPAQIESLYAPDEFRVSDHDPVLVGLRPNSPPVVDAGFDPMLTQCGPDNGSLTVDIDDRDEADTHTVTVDWGDDSDATTQEVAAGTESVTLTHTYAAAGSYEASVTVTDSHGHEVTTSAEVVVAYDTDGLEGPLTKDGKSVKKGSTLPVKIAFADCDGSVPTDIEPVVTVSQGDSTVLTVSPTLSDGVWQYNLRTGDLPGTGTFTVTVTVPSTGQTSSATFTLR